MKIVKKRFRKVYGDKLYTFITSQAGVALQILRNKSADTTGEIKRFLKNSSGKLFGNKLTTSGQRQNENYMV